MACLIDSFTKEKYRRYLPTVPVLQWHIRLSKVLYYIHKQPYQLATETN